MGAMTSKDSAASIVPSGKRSEQPRYVVVFRTHFWDEYVSRQFKRLQDRVGAGDLFVLVDETNGHVAGIPTDKVFRITDGQVLSAGYVRAGEGSIQWYSGDVPLYVFQSTYPGYDYYVQIEYDAIVNIDLDSFIEKVGKSRADIVAYREPGEDSAWHWLDTCTGFYNTSEITHLLICFSVYSRRSLEQLSRVRLEQAKQYAKGDIKSWPFCEGFIGTEARRQNMRVADLSDFGDVGAYRWWPPYAELEALRLGNHAFIHPVLEPSRFVPSVLRRASIGKLLLPNSWVHERLRRLGPVGYFRALLSEPFRKALQVAIKRKFATNG